MIKKKKIVLLLVTANPRCERGNFASEETSLASSDWTSDVFSLAKCDRTENYVTLGAKTGKPPPFVNMSERFPDAGSVDNLISEQENKATLQKKKRKKKTTTTRCKTFANIF